MEWKRPVMITLLVVSVVVLFVLLGWLLFSKTTSTRGNEEIHFQCLKCSEKFEILYSQQVDQLTAWQEADDGKWPAQYINNAHCPACDEQWTGVLTDQCPACKEWVIAEIPTEPGPNTCPECKAELNSSSGPEFTPEPLPGSDSDPDYLRAPGQGDPPVPLAPANSQ